MKYKGITFNIIKESEAKKYYLRQIIIIKFLLLENYLKKL